MLMPPQFLWEMVWQQASSARSCNLHFILSFTWSTWSAVKCAKSSSKRQTTALSRARKIGWFVRSVFGIHENLQMAVNKQAAPLCSSVTWGASAFPARVIPLPAVVFVMPASNKTNAFFNPKSPTPHRKAEMCSVVTFRRHMTTFFAWVHRNHPHDTTASTGKQAAKKVAKAKMSVGKKKNTLWNKICRTTNNLGNQQPDTNSESTRDGIATCTNQFGSIARQHNVNKWNNAASLQAPQVGASLSL